MTLLADVWGYDANVGSNAIEAVVHSLRKKLGPRSSVIETVRGFGYRFRADLSAAQAGQRSADRGPRLAWPRPAWPARRRPQPRACPQRNSATTPHQVRTASARIAQFGVRPRQTDIKDADAQTAPLAELPRRPGHAR